MSTTNNLIKRINKLKAHQRMELINPDPNIDLLTIRCYHFAEQLGKLLLLQTY